MSNIKIVFMDIDDTLNPSNGKVSKKTLDVMTRLKESGIKVVVNTGRSAKYAILKAKEANLSEYIISSNGAEVYNYETKELIYSKSIPKDTLKELYEYCESINLTMILNSLEERFINKEDYHYNNEPALYFSNIDDVINNHDIHQVVILSSNFDRMLVIPNLFKEKFPNLKIIHSSSGLIEDKREKNKEYYHDLVLDNTAKSTGIVELLEYLDISSDDAISVGNGYDDICSVDVVGTSIAVDNAVIPLKEASTYITDAASEDGAAKMLEKICFD